MIEKDYSGYWILGQAKCNHCNWVGSEDDLEKPKHPNYNKTDYIANCCPYCGLEIDS